MMTFIVVMAFLLIAFIGLLRYDIHRHKHLPPKAPQPKDSSKEINGEHPQSLHNNGSETRTREINK